MPDSLHLIADSGSTKTDWAIGHLRMATQGINPIHQGDDAIRAILRDELLPQLLSAMTNTAQPMGNGQRSMDNGQQPIANGQQPMANGQQCSLPNFQSSIFNLQSSISDVHFYGSGVRPDQTARMEGLLREAFPHAGSIDVHSDLLGAARALCGHGEGIACILGTGANSCLYDGRRIVQNTPALGYILGDEGSGAVLGIRFLNALYKGRLPHGLLEALEAESGLTLSTVIDRVYRQPLPNRFLASLSPFIHSHLDDADVQALVIEHFRSFFSRNLKPYRRQDLPVSVVGSIGFFYQEQLQRAATLEGFTLGRVVRSPLEGLQNFFSLT